MQRGNILHETFCYPNGNYNQEIVDLVINSGYKLAFTTRKGWESYNYNPFEIKRVAIHNDIAFNESLFAARISNVF